MNWVSFADKRNGMAVARTLSDGTPMPLAMQAVYAACDRFEVDQLLARLTSLLSNYPPSSVVIERFVCQDASLRTRLRETIDVFHPSATGAPRRNLGQAMAVVDPIELAQMATILVIDRIHSTVFRGSGYLSREITKSAVAMAHTMRFLAERQKLPTDQAFIFGLINRLGVPVLYEYSPIRYGTCIASLPGTTIQLIDAERGATGTDHLAVLSAICDKFEFPEWIRSAANPGSLSSALKRSAQFAALFVHAQGFDMGLANKAPHIPERLINAVGVSPLDIEELRQSLANSMSDFNQYPTDLSSVKMPTQ